MDERVPRSLAQARKHTGQRRPEKLSALGVKVIIKTGKPGRWGDGRNLSLVSKTGNSHWWEFSYRRGGKSLSVGLGSFQDVGLAQAREKAGECRAALEVQKLAVQALATRPTVQIASQNTQRCIRPGV